MSEDKEQYSAPLKIASAGVGVADAGLSVSEIVYPGLGLKGGGD